jgi:hypothetical protein
MTDREKIVELIDTVAEGTIFVSAGEQRVSINSVDIADHLPANGVTVQQWRDAKTDPPEEEKPVQCFFVNCQCVVFWTKEKGYKQWFASVGDLYFECESEPDYWQPLPKPPKEEVSE